MEYMYISVVYIYIIIFIYSICLDLLKRYESSPRVYYANKLLDLGHDLTGQETDTSEKRQRMLLALMYFVYHECTHIYIHTYIHTSLYIYTIIHIYILIYNHG